MVRTDGMADFGLTDDLAARCATAHGSDPHRYLVYAAHSGWGNQQVSLTTAMRVAYAMRRTLVLPPRLGKSDSVFGDARRECLSADKQPKMARNGLSWYRAKVRAGAAYEPIHAVHSLEHVAAMGMRFVDFRDFDRAYPGFESRPSSWVSNLTCGETILWGAKDFARFSKAMQPRHTHHASGPQQQAHARREPQVLLWGSLLMQAIKEWRPDEMGTCFTELYYRSMVLPVQGHALHTARQLAAALGSYSAVHVRAGDASLKGGSATVNSHVSRCLSAMLRWSTARIAADALPPVDAPLPTSKSSHASRLGLLRRRAAASGMPKLFIATEARLGTADPAFEMAGLRASFHVTSVHDLTSAPTPQGRKLRTQLMAGAARSNCSVGSFGLLMDVALCALADQWFVSPNALTQTIYGYRGSTLSRSVLAYWVATHPHRFAPPFNASFYRHLKLEHLELGLRLAGHGSCHLGAAACRAVATALARNLSAQRVAAGEAREQVGSRYCCGCKGVQDAEPHAVTTGTPRGSRGSDMLEAAQSTGKSTSKKPRVAKKPAKAHG